MILDKGEKQIRVRFAPSPTGTVHLGTARTALFNFLFARHYGGKCILRIEDTDKERSKEIYEENIFESLKWLNITNDEVYKQSERNHIYRKYLEVLVEKEFAYISNEAELNLGENDQTKRSEVIRFRNAGKVISFKDEIRGLIQFDTTELKDFVIAKSFDEPLYHFAVVVDDHEMGITHVIRGEDHISNTPRQILIQEAIGALRPIYFHLPLILGEDRTKLSKRHGALPILEYRGMGYLPEALMNYLALLGWSPPSENDVLTPDQLIELFDCEMIHKSPATFSNEKLDWINRKHIALLSDRDLEEYTKLYLDPKYSVQETESVLIKRLLPYIRERISKFSDLRTNYEQDFSFFFAQPEYQLYQLISPTCKEKGKVEINLTMKHLTVVRNALESIASDEITSDNIKELVWEYATEEGRSAVLWPMRYALSGRDKSPDPFSLVQVLGKQKSLERISIAIGKLESAL